MVCSIVSSWASGEFSYMVTVELTEKMGEMCNRWNRGAMKTRRDRNFNQGLGLIYGPISMPQFQPCRKEAQTRAEVSLPWPTTPSPSPGTQCCCQGSRVQGDVRDLDESRSKGWAPEW